MLCILEIGLLVCGIIVLIVGRIPWGNREVRGTPARLAGVLLILPLPLALAGGFAVGLYFGVQGGAQGQRGLPHFQLIAGVMELSILAVCGLLALAIAAANARKPLRKPLPDEFDDYDRHFREDEDRRDDRPDRDAPRPPEDGIRE